MSRWGGSSETLPGEGAGCYNLDVPLKAINPHQRLVLRSRALHRAISEKLRTRPQLLKMVRANLERWIAREAESGPPSPGLLEWRQILETRKFNEILDLLRDEGEEADRLRHATPFTGILTEPERKAIYRQYASVPA